MRRHISVFALIARNSLYKILAILLVMCVLQCSLFCFCFHETLKSYNANIDAVDQVTERTVEAPELTEGVKRFEKLIIQSFFPQIFAVFFLFITLCLCLTGTEYSVQTGYTLCRLSISEKQIFLHQAIYNMLIYLLTVTVQICVIFSLGIFYTMNTPTEFVSNQTLFLAFYRSDFLHSLLPLDEFALWIRNGIGCVTLGFAAAEFPYKQRRRRFGGAILASVLLNYVFFVVSVGSQSLIAIYIVISACLLCEIGYTIALKETFDEL